MQQDSAMRGAFPRGNGLFAVVGHRGAPMREPENTLPSFEAALAEGANGIEIDLCVTSDGEVVAWHDFDPRSSEALLRRLSLEPDVRFRPHGAEDSRYRRNVDELTLRQLRQHHGYAHKELCGERVDAHIPTLEEVMQLAVSQRDLRIVFLDIKLPPGRTPLLRPLLARLDRVVAQLQPSFEIVLESAYPTIIRALRELAPHHASALDVQPPPGLVLTPEKHSAVQAALRHGATWGAAQKPRFTTLQPFQTHLSVARHDLDLLARAEPTDGSASLVGLCCFTINEAQQMRRLIEAGVSAIQSDAPGRLCDVAKQCGRSTR